LENNEIEELLNDSNKRIRRNLRFNHNIDFKINRRDHSLSTVDISASGLGALPSELIKPPDDGAQTMNEDDDISVNADTPVIADIPVDAEAGVPQSSAPFVPRHIKDSANVINYNCNTDEWLSNIKECLNEAVDDVRQSHRTEIFREQTTQRLLKDISKALGQSPPDSTNVSTDVAMIDNIKAYKGDRRGDSTRVLCS
jgi:hypothetical protein